MPWGLFVCMPAAVILCGLMPVRALGQVEDAAVGQTEDGAVDHIFVSAANTGEVAADGGGAVTEWLEEATTATPAAAEPRRLLRRNGADRSASGPASRTTTVADGRGLWTLFWPLVIVLGVIGVIVMAVRRWLPKGSRFGGGGVINILARHHLSPKQSLCLVRLGRRVLLVGVTSDRISPVAEIGDPVEASEILAAVERGRPSSFTSVLTRFGEPTRGDEAATDELASEPALVGERTVGVGENVRSLIQRVRELSASGSTGRGTSAESTV